jgi:hypothetical protein
VFGTYTRTDYEGQQRFFNESMGLERGTKIVYGLIKKTLKP